MNKLTNLLSIASLICLGSVSSAQQCTNGNCSIHNNAQHQPTYRNTFTDRLRSMLGAPTACLSGQCDGRNCNCAPSVPNQRLNSGNPALTNGPSPYRQTNFSAPLPPQVNFGQRAYQSASIQWETNFQRASEEARRLGRPMLVRVTADWCGYCQKMKQETYTDGGVIRDIGSTFVAISLDADQNQQLVQQMGIQSLPATLIISPDMRIVDKEQGFRSAEQLSGVLRRHLQRAELDRNVTVAIR